MTTREVELIGADGTHHVLACDPLEEYSLRPDNGLWGMTPYSINSRRSVGVVGERVTNVTARVRTFGVPILVSGTTELEVDQYLGNLGSVLHPDTDTRIVFTRSDGTKREIIARYLSGAEALAVRRPDQHHVIVPLVFRAFHPYWRNVTDNGEIVSGNFLDAAFAGINSVLIWNGGDVDVWPELEFDGLCENIEGTNVTTGQSFRIIYQLPLGQTIKVDTNPESRRVLLNDFPDYAGTVDPFSDWWPLIPGWNRILLRAVSPGDAGLWRVKHRPEYDTC